MLEYTYFLSVSFRLVLIFQKKNILYSIIFFILPIFIFCRVCCPMLPLDLVVNIWLIRKNLVKVILKSRFFALKLKVYFPLSNIFHEIKLRNKLSFCNLKEQIGITFGRVHYLVLVIDTHWLEPLECYWLIQYYMVSSLGMWKQFGQESLEFLNHGRLRDFFIK